MTSGGAKEVKAKSRQNLVWLFVPLARTEDLIEAPCLISTFKHSLRSDVD
jgi:hypothetical protein